MEKQPHHKIVTQASSNNKLEYLPNNTVKLDLPFILTTEKKLQIGMPYMILDRQHTNAIRLLNVSDTDGIVYLKIQNLQTGEVNTISWNLNYSGDYWLWSIATLDYIVNL